MLPINIKCDKCGQEFLFRDGDILPEKIQCKCGQNVNLDSLKEYYYSANLLDLS